jgi:hypothetical protein
MAILAAFEEEELSRLYADVAVGGRAFDTGIVGNAKAVQQRNVNRYDAVRAFEIQFGGMSQPEKLRLEEFFITKQGRAIGFRFYPPSDRNFQNDVIGVGDGANTTFYMKRNYRSRTRFITRRIVKPVKPHRRRCCRTVQKVPYEQDGRASFTPAGDYPEYLQPDNGRLERTASSGSRRRPRPGTIIRCADGEYNIPVFFDVDEFAATDYGPFADWNSIKVVEIPAAQITSAGLALTPLALAFTSPHSDETVMGNFDVALTHTGVAKVYLYLNGVPHGSDATAPFTFASVTPPATSTGDFRMTALGVDASGNVVEAAIDLHTSITPPDTTPPSVPAGLAGIGGETSIALTWSASTD